MKFTYCTSVPREQVSLQCTSRMCDTKLIHSALHAKQQGEWHRTMRARSPYVGSGALSASSMLFRMPGLFCSSSNASWVGNQLHEKREKPRVVDGFTARWCGLMKTCRRGWYVASARCNDEQMMTAADDAPKAACMQAHKFSTTYSALIRWNLLFLALPPQCTATTISHDLPYNSYRRTYRDRLESDSASCEGLMRSGHSSITASRLGSFSPTISRTCHMKGNNKNNMASYQSCRWHAPG